MWSWIALPLYFAPVFYLIFVARRRRRALASEEAAGLSPGIKGWLSIVAFLLLAGLLLSLLAAVLSLLQPSTALAWTYPPVMLLEALLASLSAALGLHALVALQRHERRFRSAMLALISTDIVIGLAFPLLAWGMVRLFTAATPSLATIMALGEVVEELPAQLFFGAIDLVMLAYVWRSRRVAITCVR